MKRILSILLVLLLSLTVLTGCAQLNALADKLPFDIPFLGTKECTHDYDAVVTEPTCTTTGITTYTCKLCANTYTDNETAALGHNYVDGTCSACGVKDPNYVPPHVHSYTSVVTAPTCTAGGYTTYTCACGDSYEADKTDALGHNYVDGVCDVCEAEDPDYVFQNGTVDAPYILEMPGDYVAAFPGGYDLVYYQMTNAVSGGYYTISSTKGDGAWLKVGTDVYNLASNDGLGTSLTVYVPAGVACYFGVADWNETAGDVPFTVAFEAFESEPATHLVGNWKGVVETFWSSATYTVEITEDALGTIVEDGGYYKDTYNITFILVDGTTVTLFSTNEYGNSLDLTFEYDAEANTLTGGNAYFVVTLAPYDPSEEPVVDPDVTYDTVVVIGSNVLYFSADEIAADLATRVLNITEAGTYSLKAGNLFVSSVVAADGTAIAKNDDYSYTLAAGEYTLTFSMLSMFGVQADTACDLVVEAPEDIGGGDIGGGDEYPELVVDEVKESLAGTYNFDGYNVLLMTNYELGLYLANVYFQDADDAYIYDLYFTYTVTENEDGSYSLTLEYYSRPDVEIGTEYVDIVLGYEIVIGGEAPECEHNYETPNWHPDMQDATCSSTGVAVFECTLCGDIKTEETPINPENHTWDYSNPEVIVPSDCATDTTGTNKLTCSGCGATKEVESYPMHDLVETIVDPTCTEDGSYYAQCSVCGYEESNVIPTEGHFNYLPCGETGECFNCGVEFTKEHQGRAPTCTDAGFCFNCWSPYGEPTGHNYVDGVCTNCGGTPHVHDAIFVEAVEAYCHQAGAVAHWYCEGCETAFADEALTEELLDIVVPCTAEIAHVDAVEAACHQNGNVEYWYCTECDAVFTDAALTQLSNRLSVVTPATVGLTYVAAVEAACHQNGCAEYWYCAECEAVFTDAQGIYLTNIRNLTIPYTAEIAHVDAVEAACHQTGNVEYWYCTECDAVFTDAALTQLSNRLSVVIPAVAEIVHVEAVAATCVANGNLEYWYCSECNYLCTDAALTQTSNYMSCIVPATGHTEVVDAAKAPTCTATGLTEGSHCSGCGEVYTAQEVVPALGHNGYETDYKCDTCSAKVLPEDGTALTIAQALTIAKLMGNTYTTEKYYVTGMIINIANTTYGNMTIVDANGDELYLYGLYTWNKATRYDAMTTKPVVYDEITVYTILGCYNDSPQGKDTWLDEHVAHVCTDYTEATCDELAACVVCGATVGELADHNYVDGVCSVCGHKEGTAEVVKTTVTLAYTTTTTTNMTGNNDADKLGLDASVFTVIGNKGSTNNNCGLNKSGQIRLYGNSSAGNGSYFDVTIADGYTIESIKIKFTNTTNNKNCQLTVDGNSTVFDGSAQTWEVDIDSNSFRLQNVITGGTTQIYISSIEITYVASAQA